MINREAIIEEMKSRGFVHSGMYFMNPKESTYVESAVLISCVRKNAEQSLLPEAVKSCLKILLRKTTIEDK